MGNFMYPDSRTRKMYGQSGKALQRQRKSFMTEIDRMNNDHFKSHDQQMKEQKQKYEAQIKKLKRKIVAVIVISLIIITIVAWNS